jgi:hypothetical protein
VRRSRVPSEVVLERRERARETCRPRDTACSEDETHLHGACLPTVALGQSPTRRRPGPTEHDREPSPAPQAAPEAYEKFDRRVGSYTKVLLKPDLRAA